MNIGNKIKTVRLENGLTQSKLANELPVTQGYLSQIENGIRTPSIQTLDAIAKRLNVKVADLMKEA
ncbi:helix-turn-helix domain-containing protein [Thiobaca trueperi]|uniref:DNA-binding XRE family transcriptional regulator n=1 Tax=Thiobaca trueperi TaxID=127458 RepID=A0A4R3MZD6_9GAMM|nr:helix-turn-helix transcriptional regulator [Thiobaca trueperi]TCT21217.1 DNA-binding XRE family transcriptional regulator [Thiobaca trueperi]